MTIDLHPSRKPLVLACSLLLFATTAHAEHFVIEPGKDSAATFRSESSLETFEGSTHQVTGWIDLTPDALADSVTVEIEVDLASLDTGISLRNQHMRENHLQTDEYPRAVFRGARLLGDHPTHLPADQAVAFTARGELSLHGVTRTISAAIEARVLPRNALELVARFDVALGDFEISRPKFLLLKLAEVQKVTFRATAVPRDDGVVQPTR